MSYLPVFQAFRINYCKMKRVFVCQVFYPDEQATSQLFSDLLSALSRRGLEYEVLTGFAAHRPGNQKLDCVEIWNGLQIRRGGCRIDIKKNMLTRALAYGSYCCWLVWRLLFFTSASTRVLVATNPPFAPALIWLCSWFRRWHYDVMLLDIYPDGLIAIGGLRETSCVACVWRWINRQTFAKARQLLVLGRDMAELCQQEYGVAADKLFYTPHWSPMVMNARVAAEATHLWSRTALKDKFVVQYSGNMGLWHDIDTIVRAAASLQSDPRIQFLMIGSGMRKNDAESLCQQLGVVNITWLPYQPKADLGDSLSCCHAAIISQRAGLEGVAVPCKLYGILASGRAILAQVPAGSETARVIEEEECGQVIPPGDAIALAAAIRRLVANRGLVEKMGEKAFAAYRQKYTLNVAISNFAKLS